MQFNRCVLQVGLSRGPAVSCWMLECRSTVRMSTSLCDCCPLSLRSAIAANACRRVHRSSNSSCDCSCVVVSVPIFTTLRWYTSSMACTSGRVGSWLLRWRLYSSLPSVSRSSARLTQRSFHSTSSSLSCSLSTAPTSTPPLVPVYSQPQPSQLNSRLMPLWSSSDSTPHRCTAACSHYTIPSFFSRPRPSRTLMSAIDTPSSPATSTAAAMSVLFEPALRPLLDPSPAPFADVPMECAVPKRKPSPRAQRHRRAGQRATHARRLHQTYRVCLNCGSPVKPHYLCIRCRQVIGRF